MGQKKNAIIQTLGCQGHIHKYFALLPSLLSHTLLLAPFLKCSLFLPVFLHIFFRILAVATALQGCSCPTWCLLLRVSLQSDAPTPPAASFFLKHFSAVMPAQQTTLWLLLCDQNSICMLLFI